MHSVTWDTNFACLCVCSFLFELIDQSSTFACHDTNGTLPKLSSLANCACMTCAPAWMDTLQSMAACASLHLYSWCLGCGRRQQAWGRSSWGCPAYQGPSLLTLVKYAQAILKALAHTHSCRVLHRGLTPDHVLVCSHALSFVICILSCGVVSVPEVPCSFATCIVTFQHCSAACILLPMHCPCTNFVSSQMCTSYAPATGL